VEKVTLAGKELLVQIVYKKIRHTYLRIKPDNSLLITTNKRVSESSIQAFIKRNEDKIVLTLSQREHSKSAYKDGFVLHFGRMIPMIQDSTLSNPWIYSADTLYYKNAKDIQSVVRSFYLVETLKKMETMQKKWLPILASNIDISHITLKAQLMKSQFGSCQYEKRIIKLNSVLSCFDPIYLESIFLHEVVHLKEANHGTKFYALLLKYSPNYRSLRKELGKLFKTIEV